MLAQETTVAFTWAKACEIKAKTMPQKLALLGGKPVRFRPFTSWPIFGKAEEKRLLRALRSGKSDRERVDFTFKLATARAPDPQERAVLLSSLKEFRSGYQDAANASKLLSIGETKVISGLDPRELAAWTTVASMILNLDETITKQ